MVLPSVVMTVVTGTVLIALPTPAAPAKIVEDPTVVVIVLPPETIVEMTGTTVEIALPVAEDSLPLPTELPAALVAVPGAFTALVAARADELPETALAQ